MTWSGRWVNAAWRFGPLLLWMAAISGFSSDSFSSDNTGGYLLPILHWAFPGAAPADLELWHAGIRKAMHLFAYGILAILWYRTLRPPAGQWRARVALTALALSAAFAGLDEYHQTFVPSRTGSLVDVGWDSLGATLALLAYAAFRRVRASTLAKIRD